MFYVVPIQSQRFLLIVQHIIVKKIDLLKYKKENLCLNTERRKNILIAIIVNPGKKAIDNIKNMCNVKSNVPVEGSVKTSAERFCKRFF